MATAAVQMNVRIPSQLKSKGDAALASVGISPSEAVRGLWEKAAQRGEGLFQVVTLLNEPAQAKRGVDDPALLGSSIVDDALRELGISISHNVPELSDEELLELAMSERLSERGLL